jgi:hypothetical protein
LYLAAISQTVDNFYLDEQICGKNTISDTDFIIGPDNDPGKNLIDMTDITTDIT